MSDSEQNEKHRDYLTSFKKYIAYKCEIGELNGEKTRRNQKL